jgi:hypothetical protein
MILTIIIKILEEYSMQNKVEAKGDFKGDGFLFEGCWFVSLRL